MSTTPTPPNGMVSNTELILRHILGEDVTPLPPNSRVEFYLTQVEEYIERLATGATRPIGETTTPLTDGATTNPITIDGESYTAQINDLVFYGNKEFLFTVNGWREVGDITNLNADMIDDTNTTKKFTNATEKQTWNGKQDSTLASWTPGSATTHSTPAVGDSITEALQKIDNNQRNDENNIGKVQTQVLIAADQSTQYNYAIAASIEKTSASPTSTPYNDVLIPAGEYRLEFDYNTSAASQFVIAKGHYTTLVNVLPYIPQGTGHYTTTVTLSENASAYYWYCDGTGTLSNIMIMPKSLYDSGFTDYQPYALPNTKITPELIDLVDSGAKNGLNLNSLTLGLADGFTGQINSDGSVTLSGTTANTVSCRIQLGAMTGRYVLSGCPSGGGDSTYRQDIRDSSYNVITGSLDTGNGSDEFTLPSGSYLYFRFAAGTYNNVKFYPMLCSKAAWDVSQKFVPYRPTYEETVEQVSENQNNILFTATIGECESTSNTANKVVTVSDVNYTPHKGSIIAVKFKYGNNVTDTVEHPITLNVNNTGAYRIWYKNGDYANASQGKIFGLSGYYIYYMYDGVDRWVWINYCMDNTYTLMSQAEASAGTATNERLISAKVLSDTIDEKLVPVENNILSCAKLYTVSKPSDGIVNTATFDWSQLVSGTYMITCMNVTGSQNKYGISIYTFYKFGDGSIGLWTDISDITSAKISSYVVTDDTLTLTYDVYGYHNVTIINLNILS